MTIKTGAGEAVADSNGSAPRDDGYVLGVSIPELAEEPAFLSFYFIARLTLEICQVVAA